MKCKLPGFFLIIFFLSQNISTVYAQNNLQISFHKADSLFAQKEWKQARAIYESGLSDTSTNSIEWNRLGYCCFQLGDLDKAKKFFSKSLATNPPPFLKALVLSRMAMVDADKNDTEKAFKELDSAINSGYSNLSEMDSLKDFNSLRNKKQFKDLRQKVYAAAFPCMVNPHAREFDFWAGEWNVYVTGTKFYAGHSLVQIISNGCALLENWDSPASNGKSINFIDPVTNKWKQSWAGSYAGGVQEFVNGEYKDSAMRFTFETTDAQGHKIIGRFIFYNEPNGQVRQFNETSNDEGKTWTTSYDFTYIKK
jgi:hypothetical protein